MRVVTVVGARGKFIKAAPVSKLLRARGHNEYLVHTGQHYDRAMSQIFFDELSIPLPDVNLGVGSGSHGKQTGEMLARLEKVLQDQRPDFVLVYGDTNSTLAGALAAVKLHLPVAHIEAGLRSFNREMPEEHNRVLTDHCADLLFCPTKTAVDNLSHEGLNENVYLVGDTMYDAVLQFLGYANLSSNILELLDLTPKKYCLVTVHRPHNTDNPQNLTNIMSALYEFDETVVFPVHPRTKKKIHELDLYAGSFSNIQMIDPVGYLDMLVLEKNARIIVTDSGGIQKEAYFLGVPCITVRSETEWIETVESGWNTLVAASKEQILKHIASDLPLVMPPVVFGDGHAAEYIVDYLLKI